MGERSGSVDIESDSELAIIPAVANLYARSTVNRQRHCLPNLDADICFEFSHNVSRICGTLSWV